MGKPKDVKDGELVRVRPLYIKGKPEDVKDDEI
ncbi:hypothetical protein A2U01_0103122, partial [Trifolium medium]|nr:hypothetical protein [Trifolium medium]